MSICAIISRCNSIHAEIEKGHEEMMIFVKFLVIRYNSYGDKRHFMNGREWKALLDDYRKE